MHIFPALSLDQCGILGSFSGAKFKNLKLNMIFCYPVTSMLIILIVSTRSFKHANYMCVTDYDYDEQY